MKSEYEKIFSDVLNKNQEQLEKYCAAFLSETGSKEASKYILVQQTFPDKIQWRFERKNNTQSEKSCKPQEPTDLEVLKNFIEALMETTSRQQDRSLEQVLYKINSLMRGE